MTIRNRRLLAVLGAVVAVLGLSTGVAAASPVTGERSLAACPTAPAGYARCFVTVRQRTVDGRVVPAAADQISGLKPADIVAAYGLTGGATGTVAIVDGFDNPNAEADLAVYRQQWGLPACTTKNGCFRKVNQDGDAKPLPDGDPGWGVEIALDLDAVSAACPGCKILLVEGKVPSFEDLGVAENTAVRLGADAVSNSYGGDEFGLSKRLGQLYYTHPGVPIVVSSGDDGFTTAQFPAVLATSVAVGGTYLTPSANSRGSERAWRFAGSGCSAYIAKPAWQHDTHCPMRTVADVSAAADGPGHYAIYDTYGTDEFSDSPWFGVSGTSLSSPLTAAMIVRAGHADHYSDASSIYAHSGSFHDIVGGRNGFCGGDYLCVGKPGYDAPTGVGTPAGLGGL